MVYVGKEAGLHTRSQAEIHAMLCAFARDGATVLRLKGGDPFMFGRGGEEAEYLRARGIAVHTVPGVHLASRRPWSRSVWIHGIFTNAVACMHACMHACSAICSHTC